MSIRSGGEGHVLVAYDLEGGTKSNGGVGPRQIQADFSLTSKGCSNAPGTSQTVLVRALDAQGAVAMIAPLVVTVPTRSL